MSNEKQKQQEAHLREGLDMMISDYLKSYSVLELLTEMIPLCEAHLHYKAGIHDPSNPHYDLGVRIKQMDTTFKNFLDEFDLDLVVSSFIVQLRNKSDAVEDNDVLREMYGGLADMLNTGY